MPKSRVWFFTIAIVAIFMLFSAALIWISILQTQAESKPLTSADIVGTWTDKDNQNGTVTFDEDGTFVISDIPVNVAENKLESFSAQGTWRLENAESFQRLVGLSYPGLGATVLWLNTSGAGDSLRLNFFLIDKEGQFAFQKTG